ncbi:MAG: FlgD immunoglobulin-like domain containing protein [Candidatus Eisenbacteria bacterium]
MAGVLVCSLIAAPAHAYDPIAWYTFDGGGVIGAGAGGYELSGTIGQPDAGTLSGLDFSLYGGFWRGGVGSLVGVGDHNPPTLAFRLYSAMPNPVRSHSRLAFDLPTEMAVRLRIHDVSGRVVRVVQFGRMPAGHHERNWTAVDDGGRALPGGVYFMRLDAGASQAVKRVLVLR